MGGGSGPIGMQRWSRLYWVLKFHKIGDGGRFLGGPIKACSCQTLLDEISTLMLASDEKCYMYVQCTLYMM